MDTVKFNKNKTLIVAHRGLSGIETENTNAAFVAAGNRSYYGIETDIYRTADGNFVTIHDGDLNRIAGENIAVESTSLADLQNIILYDKDGTKIRADLRIPKLQDYISICKKYNKHSVLELKSDFTEDEIKKIVSIIKSQGYLGNVTFISFNYANLKRIRKILPTQSVQYLFTQFTDEIIENVTQDKMDVDVLFKALDKEIIDRLHEKGIKINCWTVDNAEIGEQLAKWGVDFITTNILE